MYYNLEMSRRPRESVNNAIELSPEVQAIGDSMRTSISTRDLIILASIDQIIETGPVDFNSGTVCDQLNLKHPMINYYFGSRDGLIVEATIWAYRGWSHKVMTAARNAPKNAEKRLRAYLDESLKWAKNMGAMTVLSQYPVLSKTVKTLIDDGYSVELQKDFEYHLVFLAVLITDMRSGKNSDLDFDQTNYPKSKYSLSHPRELLEATSVAWASHGIMMWRSGSHTPTNNMRKDFTAKFSEDIAMGIHIDNIVSIARGRK
jgi:AcrR family transcriptional regulator